MDPRDHFSPLYPEVEPDDLIDQSIPPEHLLDEIYAEMPDSGFPGDGFQPHTGLFQSPLLPPYIGDSMPGQGLLGAPNFMAPNVHDDLPPYPGQALEVPGHGQFPPDPLAPAGPVPYVLQDPTQIPPGTQLNCEHCMFLTGDFQELWHHYKNDHYEAERGVAPSDRGALCPHCDRPFRLMHSRNIHVNRNTCR